MTKEQFLDKWRFGSNPLFEADLEAVIATEIEKAKPEKTNKIEITPHTLVEVNRAFRALKQDRNSYIHKVFSDDGVFDAMEEIRKMFDNYFVEQPQEPQPALNPIVEAYERGEKIRHKNWLNGDWIQKYKETKTINNHGNINSVYPFAVIKNTENWEIYTEPTEQVTDQVTDHEQPVETKQPSSQAKLDNSFNKDRFEAMFRAVVESGENTDIDYSIKVAENALSQLDAYYATKKGGKNE